MKLKAVLLAKDVELIDRVYGPATRDRLNKCVDLHPDTIPTSDLERYQSVLREARIVFSTWGIPAFTEEQLQVYCPRLEIVFYGAGTVQSFARPYLARNIRVVSAWAANAVPVAEYTTAQIVLAHKGFYQAAGICKRDYAEAFRAAKQQPGNYGAKVGILGAGMVGKLVIKLLRNYNVSVEVFDPFLSDEEAKKLGVRKAGLVDLFERCDTISNHLANLPDTVGMIHYDHFRRMRPHATFLNTGRGAQVVEADLIRALREVPTRTAVLDVTDPEPAPAGSELLKLDNVILTPHIAGSMNSEAERMGVYMAEECERFVNGEPLRYEVMLEMLATMA